jgi:hypothetical protein
VGAANFGWAILAVDADEYAVITPVEADAFGIDAEIDTLAFEDLAYPGEMSGSSRWTRRGAISTTVTSLPKRRYICANSSPT